jgi:hypothetical protein
MTEFLHFKEKYFMPYCEFCYQEKNVFYISEYLVSASKNSEV